MDIISLHHILLFCIYLGTTGKDTVTLKCNSVFIVSMCLITTYRETDCNWDNIPHNTWQATASFPGVLTRIDSEDIWRIV